MVSLAGAPAFTYEIQGAGALGQWQALGTVTANSAGAAQFTDTAATSQPRRFYRARQATS